MKFLLRKFFVPMAGALALALSASALAKKGVDFATTPTLNNGEKWQIAYYEGGEYINYQQVLKETVRGLVELGWIEAVDIPAQSGEQTRDLWAWLVQNAQSDYIEFVADGHYSANWEESVRKDMAADIIGRLNQKKDIDLIIAMGTWAGKDLANDDHSTPTLVLSTSDPISAGIIESAENSGRRHVHAFVDPFHYERQIRIFHEIIGFKKLGVAFEDSVSGRSYAAIDVLERVGAERGFTVIPCHTQSDITDTDQAAESVKRCFHELAKNADAIYVTEQGGVNPRSITELVEIANSHRLPTFSQAGSNEVKDGFFVSLSHAGYRYVGRFHAETMAKILNGAEPNQLDQIFEQPPKIAINLKTAAIIGFDPPVVILGAADEIFTEIPNSSN